MKRDVRSVVLLLAGAALAGSGCVFHDEETSEARRALSGSSLGMAVDNATNSVTVFNADTNAVIGTLTVGPGGTAGDCSITADGRKGFFTRFNSTATVVDLTTTPPTLAGAPNPIPIANFGEDTSISPDEKFLLVCDGSVPAAVSVIDVATQTQISTFNTGTDCNSVDVCSDGSVLVTSFTTNRVRRLALSATGTLTDTGDSLTSTIPNNAVCAPDAKSGMVLQRDGRVTSFKIPGLTAVSTRTLDSLGLVGVFNRAGDRAFVRTSNGTVSSFAFDPATGTLGAAPVFSVATASVQTFFGMDQLAIHPSDTTLYVTVPGSVRILSADTGATVGTITGGAFNQPTGICFGANRNQAPVAICADRTVAADGTCHASASVDNGSFDPDGDAFECTQVPSGPFGEGSTSVTLTCTDENGASSSCTATVTVVDETAPALSCPADQTVECNDGAGGATATFTAAAIDNCDADPTVACVPPSGSTFPLGTTVDTCSASDDAGNTSTCTHNVTVADTTPAVVTTTNPAPLSPPNHQYHRIDLVGDCITSIQDACQGPLDIASHARVTCCTSDEPDNGLGDGNTTDDCVILDNHTVNVRAERSGTGNGRVYTIHYTVTDDANNTSDFTCKVSVPHSQNGDPAVDDGPQTTCGG